MTTRCTFLAFCANVRMLALGGESHAQQRRGFRVGALNLADQPSFCMDVWRAAVRELGYIEGDDILFEIRSGTPEQLPMLARELARLKVDLILSVSSPAVKAAVGLPRPVPIVALDLETDPVASGFVSTLARPGGNLTGLFLDLPEFSGKQLEILREALPGLSHVIVLWDRSMDPAPLKGMESASRALHLRVSVREVDDESTLPPIFEDATTRKAGAIVVMQSPRLLGYRLQILRLAADARLPVMGMFANFAETGALLSYGPIEEMCRRRSDYVDRILRGTKPGELPIQRPQKFDFALDMRTAKAPHLTIPQSVLTRVEQVIR